MNYIGQLSDSLARTDIEAYRGPCLSANEHVVGQQSEQERNICLRSSLSANARTFENRNDDGL
jgi:hypothetical protein